MNIEDLPKNKNAYIVPMELITRDPLNPRKTFNDIDGLKKTLKEVGLLQPITLDKNYQLIIGERRWRAASELGWTEIAAYIDTTAYTPYERIIRQIIENIQQSTAGSGMHMNPIELARAWVTAWEFKTGKKYRGIKQLKEDEARLGGVKKVFLEIAREVGVNKDIVWAQVCLLDEPKKLQEKIKDNQLRWAYVAEVARAPRDMKKQLQKKIMKDEYHNSKDVRRDITLAKTFPEQVDSVIARNRGKETTEVNRIARAITDLALALRALPPENIKNKKQREFVKNQVNWLLNKIETWMVEDITPKDYATE